MLIRGYFASLAVQAHRGALHYHVSSIGPCASRSGSRRCPLRNTSTMQESIHADKSSERLRAHKAALRKDVSRILTSLEDSYVTQQSSQLTIRLFELDNARKASCVSAYLSMPSKEALTHSILQHFLDSSPEPVSREVYVPKVIGKQSQDLVMVRVHSYSQIETFPRSRWGIPEPPIAPDKEEDGTFCGKIDLVIVPGMAFDTHCNRLGHGKGYYDSFLERLKQSNEQKGGPVPFTVGLALTEQIVEQVPMGSLDLPLDAVVTPEKVYRRSEDHR